jgi:hypothetical protein
MFCAKFYSVVSIYGFCIKSANLFPMQKIWKTITFHCLLNLRCKVAYKQVLLEEARVSKLEAKESKEKYSLQKLKK